MKVYLLNPPAVGGVKLVREGRCMQRVGAWTAPWPPITLTSAAAALRREGFDVRVSDCAIEGMGESALTAALERERPDLVVINTATASIDYDLRTADRVKDASPASFTVATGIHVSVLPEESLEATRNLDAVIRGETESALVELAARLREGTGTDGMSGLSVRDGEGLRHGPDRPFMEDLDELPFPAWDLIDLRNYLLPFTDRPFLMVTSGKGCPGRCTFCPAKPFYGSRLRLRDPARVAEEIAWDQSEFGVKDFLFWTESFTAKRDFVLALCEQMGRTCPGVRWVCNSRVDAVDPELLREMKRAGCWMIGYGVESSSQEILDRAGKGIKIEQIRRAVRSAREAGLEVTAHVLFGLPGETVDTAGRTIEFVKDLDVQFAQFYCAVPWPSTRIYEEALEKGWLTSRDWSLFEQNNSILDIEGFSPTDAMDARSRAFRRFYLRPKVLLRTAARVRSVRALRHFVSMVKEFLSWI